MSKKVVIVGGVAGGASAAARLRRLDETAEIIMFERGDYISFANCGLPYHIGGIIKERSQLLVQTEERMRERFRIDVRTRAEVLHIDRQKKQVEVMDRRRGQKYWESYDNLVLSPGAAPLRPNLPGFESRFLFTLRNMADMDEIIKAAGGEKNEPVAVIGGGFIGLEMAENLTHRGFKVTLIELADQVMLNLDREMAAFVHDHLRENGVFLNLKDGVASVEEYKNGINLLLQSGQKIEAKFAVLAIGVRPENKLAKDAGLVLGHQGGILVGHDLRTSDPDIFAVGDAAEVPLLQGANTSGSIPLANPANRQGRLVADIISGQNVVYEGALGTAVAKIFDLTVASTGANEKSLKNLRIPYKTCIVHPNDHAGYYPGARTMSLKLLFADDGKILGAQALGYQGVEKRIDVISTAISFHAGVNDLAGLELAYAPPYSSAKDPVNVAGYVAGNIINKMVQITTWDEVDHLLQKGAVALDVRETAERLTGMIENSIHIPLGQLRERINELPKEKTIVIYCAVGLRAYIACRILMQNGFTDVRNLSGGYRIYAKIKEDLRAYKYPIYDSDKETLSYVRQAAEDRMKLDACGLQCPGPIMQLYSKIQTMEEGQEVEVTATDPGFLNDAKAWAQRTGNTVIYAENKEGRVFVVVRKGAAKDIYMQGKESGQDKTIVVFSGDLDKTIASFIIATGAAAMGRKVTMFFTFWGLNVLRRPEKVKVKKGFLERMFGFMMPRGSINLTLSRMNMMGMGSRMIRYVMGKKHIASLEDLLHQAVKMGIRLVACQMSMDVMGIKKEELLEGVETGGVASYLAAAEEGNVNLFI